MHFKQKSILVLILIVTLLVVGCQDSNTQDNDIVAKVGEKEITKSEYDKHLALYKNDYEGMYGEDIWSVDYEGKTFLQAVQEQVLDKMVNNAVVENYLIKNDFKPDENLVEEKYKAYMEAIEDQEAIKDLFKENDIDETFLKNQIKASIYMEEFYRLATEEVDVSDESLKKYYNDNREKYEKNLAKASHILVKTEEEAKDILKKINAGEDFEKLAKEYSIDPGSAAEGGNLGVFSTGMMVPEFEKAAFELEPGEISDIVKTQHGYHIIKGFEVTFEDVKEDTKNLLINEKYMTKLEEVKEGVNIEKFEENIK